MMQAAACSEIPAGYMVYVIHTMVRPTPTEFMKTTFFFEVLRIRWIITQEMF